MLLENRITKGFDRIGDTILIGAANLLRDIHGKPAAVVLCGVSLDLSNMRFLSRDLQAELALYVPENDPLHVVYSTFKNHVGKTTHHLAVEQEDGKTSLETLFQQESISNPSRIRESENGIRFLIALADDVHYQTSGLPLVSNLGDVFGFLLVGRDMESEYQNRIAVLGELESALTKVAALDDSRKQITDACEEQSLSLANVNASVGHTRSALEQQFAIAYRESQSSVWIASVAVLVSLVVFGTIVWFTQKRVLDPLQASFQHIQDAKQDLEAQAEQLREAQLQAETANRAKSQFLANMSHEVRTPMTAILGYADLMTMDESTPLSEQQSSYLQTIKSSGNHLLQVINDILDISKIEAGKFDITNERTDLLQLLQCVRDLTQPRANEKDLNYSIACTGRLPRWIDTDELRFDRS